MKSLIWKCRQTYNRKILAVICVICLALGIVSSSGILIGIADNPQINLSSFHDPCSDLSLITDRSQNWQVDSNATIQKQFLTKNQNEDGYLTYKVNGYIRRFEVAALVYAGFGDPQRDIDVYLSEDGEQWKKLFVTTSPIVPDPAYQAGDAVAWQNSTVSTENYIGGKYSYLKIVVKKFDNGVTWSIGVDDVVIMYSDQENDVPLLPGTFVEDETLVDEFVNLDNVSSKTDTWDVFNPHPETGLSVIGRKSASFDNIITYKPEGKAITGIVIAVQYVPDFVDINSHIKVSVRAAGTDEWTDLALSISQPQDIPDATNNVFKSAQITPSVSLPSNIAEVKIQLLNDVLWTLFLDRVTMGLANLDIPDETTPEEPTDPTPVKEYNFVDELENFDKIADLSDNWESFNPHPESGLSVIGKTNGKRGYASYMQKGKTITDFEISLQLAPAFFNQDAHLLVQVRQKGSEDWQTVKVKCSLPVSAGGVFSTTLVTPDETLPENIEELKITLYNDVAWTLMLDAVKINYTGQAEPSDTTTEPSNTSTTSKPVTTSPNETNPKTGNSVAILPVLLMVIGASLVSTMWRKNLKTTTK